MDVVLLSRLQFAFTIGFHYLYPPLSIGLGVALVLMEGLYLQTGRKLYEDMTRFWVNDLRRSSSPSASPRASSWSSSSAPTGPPTRATWATSSAARWPPRASSPSSSSRASWPSCSSAGTAWASACTSSRPAWCAWAPIFSALWIVVANSWQQTPAGFHIVQTANGPRAEITDFWAMVFNPSTLDRLSHTLSAAVLAGAHAGPERRRLVPAASAGTSEFARGSLRIGLVAADRLLAGAAAHRPRQRRRRRRAPAGQAGGVRGALSRVGAGRHVPVRAGSTRSTRTVRFGVAHPRHAELADPRRQRHAPSPACAASRPTSGRRSTSSSRATT